MPMRIQIEKNDNHRTEAKAELTRALPPQLGDRSSDGRVVAGWLRKE